MPAASTTSRKAKAESGTLDEATRMAKALSHPVRRKVLARLNEAVLSPNDLSIELGERLGNVSYHVRALRDLDCIELVDTKPRRGAVEHYYRATRRAMGDKDVWDRLPESARRSFAIGWFTEAFGDAQKAIDAGGFEQRPECHLSHTLLHLDEQAWRKLSTRMDSLLDFAFGLQAESAARLQKGTSEGEIRTRVILAQYEAAAQQPKRSREKKRR